jgi:hypothetical protein
MNEWTWKQIILGVFVYVLARSFVDALQFGVSGTFLTAWVVGAVFAEVRAAARTGADDV